MYFIFKKKTTSQELNLKMNYRNLSLIDLVSKFIFRHANQFDIDAIVYALRTMCTLYATERCSSSYERASGRGPPVQIRIFFIGDFPRVRSLLCKQIVSSYSGLTRGPESIPPPLRSISHVILRNACAGWLRCSLYFIWWTM